MRLLTLTSAVLCVALAACGGGGSSGGSSNPVPTTNPGGGGGGGGGGTPASTPQQAMVGGSTAFVTSGKMTLYLFGADTSGHSNCTGACAAIWVPYTAPAGTTAPSGFSLTTRSDGTLQWTFNGWPLYTYVGDSAAGQNNGNGLVQFGGLWQTARPSASGAGSGSGGGGGGNPY